MIMTVDTQTRPSIDERVTAGADWLDRHGPADWPALVNIHTLDLGNPTCCPLGQVFGNYWFAVAAGPTPLISFASAYPYGFNVYSWLEEPDNEAHPEADQLRDTWVAEIIRRRSTANLGYRVQPDKTGVCRYRCAVPVDLTQHRSWKMWSAHTQTWVCGQALPDTAECGYHYDGTDPDLVPVITP